MDCIIWLDEKGRFSLLDRVTNQPLLAENGQPLTDLSFKQAMELCEAHPGQGAELAAAETRRLGDSMEPP